MAPEIKRFCIGFGVMLALVVAAGIYLNFARLVKLLPSGW